jgi:TolA-binding protein
MPTQTSFRTARLAVLAGALLLVSGCATKNDVRDLQLELQRELRAVQARQDSLLVALRSTQDATRSTQDATEQELMNTRGEIVNQLRRISQQISEVQELAGQNQLAIAGLNDQMARAGRGGTATGGAPTSGAEPRDGLLAPGVGGSPEDDYAAAMSLYQSGSFVGARAAFEDFLLSYPQHELVSLVHFNLGDIAEQEDRLDDAIASFERVGEFDPTSMKVPDALYRIGLIHMERDEDGDARRVFERIINTWEDSDDFLAAGIVQQARDRLEELGG